MPKIKYDASIMKYISLFESITRARVKDCISNGSLTFMVNEGELGKAIGKNGANVKMLENVMKKKIRVVEFSNDIAELIKNLIYPINAKEIKQENNSVIIACNDTQSKGILIGRNRHNLDNLRNVVKRYFDVEEIKVL